MELGSIIFYVKSSHVVLDSLQLGQPDSGARMSSRGRGEGSMYS